MSIVVYLLSAVSIIWGLRSRNKVMGQVQTVCPQCKRRGFQTVVRSRRWFALYFIPMIPLYKRTIARCNLCGFQYAMNNEQADALFPQGQAAAQPQAVPAATSAASPAQPQQSTQQIMDEGVSFYKAGRYVEALAAFDRLIQLAPNYAGAYFNKGNALVGMGRFEEAVAAYDQAIHLAPNVADAYTAKGRALESLGRVDEAQKAYRNARI